MRHVFLNPESNDAARPETEQEATNPPQSFGWPPWRRPSCGGRGKNGTLHKSTTYARKPMKRPGKNETVCLLGLSAVSATVTKALRPSGRCAAEKRKPLAPGDLRRRFRFVARAKEAVKETPPGAEVNPEVLAPKEVAAQTRACAGDRTRGKQDGRGGRVRTRAAGADIHLAVVRRKSQCP